MRQNKFFAQKRRKIAIVRLWVFQKTKNAGRMNSYRKPKIVGKRELLREGRMDQAVGMASLEEAFNTMNAKAGANLINIAQVLAERFPRRLVSSGMRLTGKSKERVAVEIIGENSPAGMCIVHWPDRVITWSNNAYQAYFLDLELRTANVGARIDEVIPGFAECGLESIFERVAITGQPFTTDNYELQLPMAGKTFWNWSLTAMPAMQGEASLLVQMYRVNPPLLVSVA